MKIKILVLMAILAGTGLTLTAKNNTSFGVAANKSLAIYSDDRGLMDEVYGFGFDFKTNFDETTYLNLGLNYSSYYFNKGILFQDNKMLEASSIDFIINGIIYLSKPDKFTPYVGAGVGLLFGISNSDELAVIPQQGVLDENDSDYFSEYSLFFNVKAGVLIPLHKEVFGTIDLDLVMIGTGNVSIIPKLNFGVSYWLD